MTVSKRQVITVCFPSGPVKGWCRPLCIFFSTFTIVMLLLVMSIDLKGRQYLPIDAVIWNFEGSPQDSGVLIETIRKDYIHPPNNETVSNVSNIIPSRQLLKILKNKENGVAIECGATFHPSDADWLVRHFEWRNLKIQPNPVEIDLLRTGAHGAYTSHSCISIDPTPSHTHIQTSTNFPNGTLTAVPCFPLFSIMKAFNATTLDLLIFNDIKLPLRILQTLPTHGLANIRIISFDSRDKKSNRTDDGADYCCSEKTRYLMKTWGYSTASSCPSKNSICYFKCSRLFCPLNSNDTKDV